MAHYPHILLHLPDDISAKARLILEGNAESADYNVTPESHPLHYIFHIDGSDYPALVILLIK